jgi:squalene-hopene/tetraprenyl-beta-curcumene cyclase
MRRFALLIVAALVALQTAMSASAQDAPTAQALAAKGIAYFKSAQAADGSFSSDAGPGVTGVVAAALLASGEKPTEPVVAKALAYLETFIHEDGGMYPEGSRHKNYETCVAMMAFHAANADGKYNDLLKKAEAFIRMEQWDEGENQKPGDPAYGGSGYGGGSRPDLSNTTFLIETLKLVGNSDEDPAIQRALEFVSRCQNLDSPHNKSEFAGKIGDGGFYYTIAAGGSSPAGNTENGGLRSYGSMSYAGLRSMIYAGVGKDDQRVKAVREWIGKNYTLEENPGVGPMGLYYYYHTFAKALAAVGEAELKDAAGATHNWKQEFVAEMAERQQANGSWVNKDHERWLENDPNLVTGYVLLALSYCK